MVVLIGLGVACNKSINKLLALNLLNNVLVIIITERSTQLVIIHIMLILAKTPQFSHFFSIDKLEFTLIIGPGYDCFVLLFVN